MIRLLHAEARHGYFIILPANTLRTRSILAARQLPPEPCLAVMNLEETIQGQPIPSHSMALARVYSATSHAYHTAHIQQAGGGGI